MTSVRPPERGGTYFFAASIDQLVQVHWWWTSWSNAPRTIIIVVVLVVVVVPQQNWLFNSWRPVVWGSLKILVFTELEIAAAPWKLSNLDELQLNHVESNVTFLLGFWFLFPFSEHEMIAAKSTDCRNHATMCVTFLRTVDLHFERSNLLGSW